MQITTMRIVFGIEYGIYSLLNNFFVDEQYKIKGGEGTLYLTPETIIQGKFILFDADIFSNPENDTMPDGVTKASDYYYDYNKDENSPINYVLTGKSELRKTLAGWYYALRNFALVALLSVLAYVSIEKDV